MKPTNRHQRLRGAISLAAFLCNAAVLLGLVAYFASIRQATGREIASLEKTRDNLRSVAHRLEMERRQVETERQQAGSDKRVVLNLLRLCREAADIPDLPGNRIVSRHQGYGELCMYVPEGTHTLEISCRWKPKPTRVTPADTGPDEAGSAGEETWRIPLRSSSGYRLELESDRNGGPLQWELTSNHAGFETQSGTIPLDDFKHRGSSWTESDVILFPNQIERISFNNLQAADISPQGIRLMTMTLHGPLHEQQHEVTFAARLISEGRACVSTSEAQRLMILGREELLLPYEGGGKYDLRGPSDAVAR